MVKLSPFYMKIEDFKNLLYKLNKGKVLKSKTVKMSEKDDIFS